MRRENTGQYLEAGFSRVNIWHKGMRKQLATGISCHGNCGCFILFSNHEYLPSQRMNFSLICLWRSKSLYLMVVSENLLWAWGKCHELIAQLDYNRQLFYNSMSPVFCCLQNTVTGGCSYSRVWFMAARCSWTKVGCLPQQKTTAIFLNLIIFAG